MEIAGYQVIDFYKFNYMSLLDYDFKRISNAGRPRYVYDRVITVDSETSVYDGIPYITDWTICIEDIICLYGHHVRDLINTIDKIAYYLQSDEIHMVRFYIHNFPYDYTFMKAFMFEKWSEPKNVLAVKSHQYITMSWANGIEIRDSYILVNRSLEKLCEDVDTGVEKAVGYWNYSKIRTPDSPRTYKECVYAATDTIAQCIAIRKYMSDRGYSVPNCPLTNTGFIRNKARRYASRWKKSGHKWYYYFQKQKLSVEQYKQLEQCYHGGYTHANRYYVGRMISSATFGWVGKSKDFISSYPAVLCYEKYPMTNFEYADFNLNDIMDLKDEYAFSGYIRLVNLHLKKEEPMPPLSYHKAVSVVESVCDNGRILDADLVIYPFTDPDLDDIIRCYDYDYADVSKVMYARKEYLPTWITDLIMELYTHKCTLKNTDPALYMISKNELNGIYGMCVQKIIREVLEEDYTTGEWSKNNAKTDEDWIEKFYKSWKSFLPYQWGVWVTAYAQRNLFEVGRCCEIWIYSDTDSVKGYKWNEIKLREYNQKIMQKSEERGLGRVDYKGNAYILGIADDDGEFVEFKTMGSKRYAYRDIDGELHLTVAGVPKKEGLQCLHGTLGEFKKGKIFRNEGFAKWKMRPEYINNEDVKILHLMGSDIEYSSGIILHETEYELDHTIPYDKETGMPCEFEISQYSDF